MARDKLAVKPFSSVLRGEPYNVIVYNIFPFYIRPVSALNDESPLGMADSSNKLDWSI